MNPPLPVFAFLRVAWLLRLPAALCAQDEPSYAEKLGWPEGSRVVILPQGGPACPWNAVASLTAARFLA